MDIIEKARELGRLIQEEDSYKKLQDAQKNADADMELQLSLIHISEPTRH